jgi:hypothetical protein
MLHMVGHPVVVAGVHAANTAGPGRVTMPLFFVVTGILFFMLVALVWARRTFAFEIFVCGILFFAIGGSPIGRAFYEWLWHVQIGG